LLVNLEAAQLFSLKDKTALLTGATGYLGRTMARALLSNGARVLALGRSERLHELETKWRDEFGPDRAAAFQIDMYDLPALAKLLDSIVASEKSVDILINNAHELGAATGFNVPSGSLENATLEQWQRNLTGGVFWPALTTQKIGPAMRKNGRGSIVNISTMYAVVAPSPALYEGTNFINPPGYSASKAALLALTRYTASFWGRHGIRCNAILPGPFSNVEDTGQNSVKQNDFFLDRLKARTCLGRLGHPNELVGPLLFLASDASSYVTGHALMVEGGWTII
jgi:NAD(P)-dependent dehydrogenase (short-subunit alcohol dehydrogenase family)